MGETSRLMLPWPVLGDSADVPRDVKALADALDNVAPISSGTIASRPTSTAGSPGIRDRLFRSTNETNLNGDTGVVWVDTGNGWVAVNPALPVDGAQNVGTLRTLGTGHQQGLPGDHVSVTNSRTPSAHAPSHDPLTPGSDPVDYSHVHLVGNLSDRPSATAQYKGLTWFALDTKTLSECYYNGTAWVWIDVAAPVSAGIALQKSIIATNTAISSTPLAVAPGTPDRCTVVLPTDGLIFTRADFGIVVTGGGLQNTGHGADVFVGGVGTGRHVYGSSPFGYSNQDTRGTIGGNSMQNQGPMAAVSSTPKLLTDDQTNLTGVQDTNGRGLGNHWDIWEAAAGSYVIELRFKYGGSGTFNVQHRHLYAYGAS